MTTISNIPVEFETLGPDVTESFAKNGVTCIRGLVDPADVEHLRKWTDVAISSRNQDNQFSNGTYIRETRLSARFDGFRDFIDRSRCGEAAWWILGGRQVRLFNDTIFVKEPSAPDPTPWHQDQQGINLDGFNVCGLWIALDPVTEATGAMSYVLGSHLWGKAFDPLHDADPYDGPAPDIDADPEGYPTVMFDLQPGDAVFHHLQTLHKAGPNTSQHVRRRAYTIRFAGDDCTWIDRKFVTAKFETPLSPGDPIAGPTFPILWPKPS